MVLQAGQNGCENEWCCRLQVQTSRAIPVRVTFKLLLKFIHLQRPYRRTKDPLRVLRHPNDVANITVSVRHPPAESLHL